MDISANKLCHVVALPYPERGHINPMLNLCKLILSKSNKIFITFVVTEEWLGYLSSELKHTPPNFQLAALPQVIPSETERAADVMGFIEAVLTRLQGPFEHLLDRLQPPPTAIVYDVIMSWVVGVGNQRNIALASFVTVSASFFTLYIHFDLLGQNGHVPDADISERGNELVDYIPGLLPITVADMPTSFQGNDGKKVLHQVIQAVDSLNNSQYLLTTSIYEFEEQAINCLKAKFPMQHYHIGPMIPYFNQTNGDNNGSSYYFQWLDSQPKGSVLYISQGSFLSTSNDQSQEIIAGIKASNVRFLCVTRCDTTLLLNNNEVGLFVPWCDQLKVLCHPSVGGFWTHCGWNSISEGIYAGVPMLTSPIFWDQLLNSKMIVDDLRIGWRVVKHNHFKDKVLVTKEEITQVVRKFMDPENCERKELLSRAKELKDTFIKATTHGGSSAFHLDAFICDILQQG